MVAFFGVAAYVDASSTKVRSVELRNVDLDGSPTKCFHPQRRCEAWSFAMTTVPNRAASPNHPQRRCEAWSFAIGGRPSALLPDHPQRRCEAWSFAMRYDRKGCPPDSILNEGAKRGASQL